MKTGFVSHPIYRQHDTGPSHPESPQRLASIEGHLVKTGLISELIEIAPATYPDLADWIGAVHQPTYYQTLQKLVPDRQRVYLDPDTPFAPMSLPAAEKAVAGVLTAIDRVMSGNVQNAFCAVRPPGHHAEADRAMGFCLLNNVAIGARYLQKKYRLPKVFILDWDVHHGNGTQHIFYADPTVFYFSTHQYPFYPGTGSERERGAGAGEGFTLNVPMASGDGDREMLERFEKVLAPTLSAFNPDFILISAGFDAHRDDPLASLAVTARGFAEMTEIVRSLAETHCQGRVVSCLEGGYNLAALARSVGEHLTVLSR
ncbi:MAG: histone deacetylase [Nitrospirae bacterium]|nr:histone deacetylase [Candidatus Manganitrophaceae bacterium]